jgi:hypothetical protein
MRKPRWLKGSTWHVAFILAEAGIKHQASGHRRRRQRLLRFWRPTMTIGHVLLSGRSVLRVVGVL